MIVNDIRLPQYVRLIPRSEVKNPGPDGKTETGFAPQAGTPYALSLTDFLSPLGIPCQQPPYGTFSAIDLVTRKIVWQVPAGTVEDMGPLGIKTGLQIPIGMPTLGGPITTASGLTFFAGTMVYYLRALDTETGQEVWKARMPAGSQATPMSYLSPATGRQYVVISVGGTRGSADRGDYLIAYALPK
ncbi:hypothetical protein [Agrobacterium sp. Ap1]|uniref:hypothetical protein n=1 Tax=Agrobacterium sp. Ap1 TaxID=2815337 RepID=UPI00336BF79A